MAKKEVQVNTPSFNNKSAKKGKSGGSTKSEFPLTILKAGTAGPMVGEVTHNKAKIWAWCHFLEVSGDLFIRIKEPGKYWDQSEKHYMVNMRAIISGLTARTKYEYRLYSIYNDDHLYGGSFKTSAAPYQQPENFTVGLASCMDFSRQPKQKGFEDMHKRKPDMVFLMGDNVYYDDTDSEEIFHESGRKFSNSKVRRMIWTRHFNQRKVGNFAKVVRHSQTLATWDDHDYGHNNSDSKFYQKEVSLETFRWLWPNPYHGGPSPGIYFDHVYNRVHFFFLDGRFNRKGKDMFGETQLDWFEEKIKKSTGIFKVIVTGTPLTVAKDSIAYHTDSYERIREIVGRNRISGVLFFTGDIHRSEIDSSKEIPEFSPTNWLESIDPKSVPSANFARKNWSKPLGPILERELTGYRFTDVISSGIAKRQKRTYATVDFVMEDDDPYIHIKIRKFGSKPKVIDSKKIFAKNLRFRFREYDILPEIDEDYTCIGGCNHPAHLDRIPADDPLRDRLLYSPHFRTMDLRYCLAVPQGNDLYEGLWRNRDSVFIEGFHYDKKDKTLCVKFHTIKHRYLYKGVPESVFHEMLKGFQSDKGSAGYVFNKRIRWKSSSYEGTRGSDHKDVGKQVINETYFD